MSIATSPSIDIGSDGSGPLVERLRPLPHALRVATLMTLLRTHIAARLHLEPSELQPRTPLMALGMSSLQSVEVKMFLEKELKTALPASLVFDYPTLAALVPRILELSGLPDVATHPYAIPVERDGRTDGGVRAVVDELADELEQLRRQGAL